MTELTREELARLSDLHAKATPCSDWVWDEMEVDDEGYVFVPECSYLGPTNIALSDTYENSGNDCRYIAAALNALPALLQLAQRVMDAPSDELRKVAKRNLRSLIERSRDPEKELMLKCLEVLS